MATPTISGKITPFLWFDGQAEPAAEWYTSIFPDSRVTATTRYGEGAPMPKGTAMTVSFELCGQRFIALNGGPQHRFNEAVSFLVNCETQEEIDRYWEKLTAEGGRPIQCGWLTDRFGLAWQIVPAIFFDWIMGPNSERVMGAMMQMVKLDIAGLKAAAEGR